MRDKSPLGLGGRVTKSIPQYETAPGGPETAGVHYGTEPPAVTRCMRRRGGRS